MLETNFLRVLSQVGTWPLAGALAAGIAFVALDRGARLAALRGDHRRAEHWSSEAREVHESICANAVGERGNFTQCYGSEELDGSLLVLPMLGFLPANDDRIREQLRRWVESVSPS